MKTSWGKPVHVISFIRTLMMVLAIADKCKWKQRFPLPTAASAVGLRFVRLYSRVFPAPPDLRFIQSLQPTRMA